MVMYVLLTGRQPFSTPKTEDPMVVMRRIVDENYIVKYPPYVSSAAKVRRRGSKGRGRGRGRGRGQQQCWWMIHHVKQAWCVSGVAEQLIGRVAGAQAPDTPP